MNETGGLEPERSAGDFAFSESDFQRVRGLIHRHAGISLSESKRQMVYSRLGRRLRALGIASFAEYLDRLESGGEAEWEAFTNALTTNLTSFFRESHHFPILAEYLAKLGRDRPIMLWCSACSTGEEPYSMAMAALAALGAAGHKVRILASDVDTNVLAKAERGVYPLEALKSLPEGYARRFFLRGSGAQAGMAKVRPEVRELIVFRRINLLENGWPVRGPFDAIFCRNVMIYFDKSTQYRMLSRFVPLMRPDGLLFAGHSESLHHAADLFRLRGKTVYQLAASARANHG